MRSKTHHPSVMEEAFKKILAEDTPLTRTILDGLVRKARNRMRQCPPKSWDANLSYKTYIKLQRAGTLQ